MGRIFTQATPAGISWGPYTYTHRYVCPFSMTAAPGLYRLVGPGRTHTDGACGAVACCVAFRLFVDHNNPATIPTRAAIVTIERLAICPPRRFRESNKTLSTSRHGGERFDKGGLLAPHNFDRTPSQWNVPIGEHVAASTHPQLPSLDSRVHFQIFLGLSRGFRDRPACARSFHLALLKQRFSCDLSTNSWLVG